jgi:hypothetical protein
MWTPARNERPSGRTLARVAWAARIAAGRAVERGEEAVACGVPLLAAKARELPADESVVLREQISPVAVTEIGSPLDRPDDVGEEQCGEDTLRHIRRLFASDKALHLFDDPWPSLQAEPALAGKPDRSRGRDTGRNVKRGCLSVCWVAS